MRKQDIQLMTEYAETAPLAYGREPSTPPVRVRFTDLRPGVWVEAWTEEVVVRSGAKMTDGKMWRAITERRPMIRQEAEAAGHFERPTSWQVLTDLNVGTRRKVWQSTGGALPAERMSPSGEWRPALVQPAAVHRTWAEVQAKHDASRARHDEMARQARVAEVADLLERLGLGDLFDVKIAHGAIAGQVQPVPRLTSHNTTTGDEMVERLQALLRKAVSV